MILVQSKKEFEIYWSAREQKYLVYKFNQLVLTTFKLKEAENYIL